jgi:cytochrome c biogenesis protein CcmG, thiol:disulfide interchange protein DsbE
MKAVSWRLAPFLLFILIAIFLWRGLSLDPQNLPSVQLGKRLPDFHLRVLGDKTAQLTPDTMRGQVVLLNVWASWCDACAKEQIFLTELANKGVIIYGINYKDDIKNAKNWLMEWGNPYQLIGKDNDGRAAIDLGVYGAPETFLIDAQGVIQYRYAGVLNEQVWQQEFLPRMRQLESKL